WVQALWVSLGIVAGFLLLIFSAPWLVWQFYNAKAKGNKASKEKAYNIYTAAMYYLNQVGMPRGPQSPQQYAEAIDKRFGTSFNAFNNVYQKLKYSSIPLTTKEQVVVENFYQPFKQQVRTQIPAKTRVSRFLNIYNTLHFFTKPKIG
ncbi:MAG: transglutaminase-like enzyme putative cysteine protease, partial [Segetibacter sp.]|nr:transglutaminase-like enzyme putative cysteine protease [Segetibacter sp.]